MRLPFSVFIFTLLLFSAGCNRTDVNNARAYIEGKVSGSNIDFSKVSIKIISDQVTVAETIPQTSGDFVLSGPLISKSYSLILNKKIKSFSASKPGCTLSGDSMQITIPSGITYLVFNEIVLE